MALNLRRSDGKNREWRLFPRDLLSFQRTCSIGETNPNYRRASSNLRSQNESNPKIHRRPATPNYRRHRIERCDSCHHLREYQILCWRRHPFSRKSTFSRIPVLPSPRKCSLRIRFRSPRHLRHISLRPMIIGEGFFGILLLYNLLIIVSIVYSMR